MSKRVNISRIDEKLKSQLSNEMVQAFMQAEYYNRPYPDVIFFLQDLESLIARLEETKQDLRDLYKFLESKYEVPMEQTIPKEDLYCANDEESDLLGNLSITPQPVYPDSVPPEEYPEDEDWEVEIHEGDEESGMVFGTPDEDPGLPEDPDEAEPQNTEGSDKTENIVKLDQSEESD